MAGEPTLTVSAFGPSFNQTETVDPAAADHFVVTTGFSDPDPAGAAGTVTVTAVDPYGNTVGSGPDQYEGTVRLSTTDSRATGLPASYAFTAGDGGSHTFTGVSLVTAGDQTITATDTATSTITGDVAVDVIPAPASQVLITSPALSLVAGGRGPITAAFEDAYGNAGAVAADPQTIALTTTSAGGAFYASSTSTTAITSVVVPAGQSATTFDYGDTTAGTPTVTAADAAFPSSADQTEMVVPAAADHFVVTTSFADPDIAGTVGTVTVVAKDPYGNTVGSGPNLYEGTVDLSTTDPQAVGLPASHAFAATDAGTYTFTGVTLETAGTQTITAVDSTTGSITGDAAVVVVPASASAFDVTTSFADPDVAGTVGTVTVVAKDPYGNTAGSGPDQYEGTVDLTTTDPRAVGLPASHAFAAADAGTYTFTGVILVTAGSQTITAVDSATGSITGAATVDVVAASADAVVIVGAPISMIAGGRGSIALQFKDAYGNAGAVSAGAQAIALGTTSAAGAFYATATSTAAIASIDVPAGQSSVAVSYGDTMAGEPTLTVSAFGPSFNQTETVDPAAADHFVVTTGFLDPDPAGAAGTVTVTAVDPYGNTVGSGPDQYEGTVRLSTTDSRATGLPASYAFTAGDGGSHTFTGVILKTAGSQTINAADSANGTVAGGATVHVAGDAATQLVMTTAPPSPVVSGQSFTVVVSAEDAYGNVDTSFDGNVTISLPGQTGSTTVQAHAGVATFAGLTLDSTAQGDSIQVTATGLPSVTTGPVTISGGGSGGGGSGGSGGGSNPPGGGDAVTNAQAPTITGELVLMSRKTNKKGKAVGKATLTGFVLEYSGAMNAATAGSSANYVVDAATTKKVKKKKVTTLTPVGFGASYDPVKKTVTLTLSGKQTFATGGEITVNYGPGGVSSQDGVALDPSDAKFTIQPKATGIAPG
jgi:hypothetical protein